MRNLLPVVVLASFAVGFGACENPEIPTEASEKTSAEITASSQPDRGGEGQGALFLEAPFVPGFRMVDSATGTVCRAFLSGLDLNDFMTRQPNGHWSIHLQGYEASLQVTKLSGETYRGTGIFSSSGAFDENPFDVDEPLSVALNFNVYATGSVENEDGDRKQAVCQFQLNSRGLINSEVELR